MEYLEYKLLRKLRNPDNNVTSKNPSERAFLLIYFVFAIDLEIQFLVQININPWSKIGISKSALFGTP